MKWFNIRKIDEQVEIGKWYVGWKSRDFEISYRTEGYQYNNAEIHISIFGWHSMFRLPWTHKRDWFKGEKMYGVFVYNKTLFGHWGWKMKGWELPFVSYGNAVRWERYKGDPDSYLISSQDKKKIGDCTQVGKIIKETVRIQPHGNMITQTRMMEKLFLVNSGWKKWNGEGNGCAGQKCSQRQNDSLK